MATQFHDEQMNFDYWRHTAAIDLLPQHLEDFQRLVKLLKSSPSFQLLFARINDLTYRDLLISKLVEMPESEGRQVHKIDLGDEGKFPDFAALESWLETHGKSRAVIHLLNASVWLQGKNLEALNLRRNALAEKLDSTLIWWLSGSAVQRVAQQAPDAWSWRGGVFDFLDNEPQRLMSIPLEVNAPSIGNLSLADCSKRLAVLNQQLNEDTEIPDDFRLNLLLEQSDLLESIGKWNEAEQELRDKALPLAEKMSDLRSVALVHGKIADFMQLRGEFEAALNILEQQVLPVYEKLGDLRKTAITRGHIADILEVRGELEEAMRIHEKEELPVYQKLGDNPHAAVAAGKMADILHKQGESDKALKIYQGLLPIFEGLGNARNVALSHSKIAAILVTRGELDEALRILEQQVLPVYQKLGDLHGAAITRLKIARIMAERGNVDGALNSFKLILTDFEKIGDVRSANLIRKIINNSLALKEQASSADQSKGSAGEEKNSPAIPPE